MAPPEPVDGDKRLDQLLARACDNILSAAEARELAEQLRHHPEARQRFVEVMSLEALLEEQHEESLLTTSRALALPAKASPPVQTDPGLAATSSALSASTTFLRWPEKPHLLQSLLALAASLLVAWAATTYWGGKPPSPTTMMAQRPTAVVGQRVGRIKEVVPVTWASHVAQADDTVVGGQRLRLLEGTAQIQLDGGVVVTLQGPADVEVVSGNYLRASAGIMQTVALSSTGGFVVETPSAQLVQIADDWSDTETEAGYGLQISEDGSTDVVIFDGEIALQFAEEQAVRSRSPPRQSLSFRTPRAVRRLGAGEALRVNKSGDLERIVSVDGAHLPHSANELRGALEVVIEAVSDNLRDFESDFYYQVNHGALGDDVRAFVDRLHEWNGVDAQGVPEFLRGADYVMTFNQDKWRDDLVVQVALARPATLYVLIDDRTLPPDWLVRRFTDTGFHIGLDEGWYHPDGRRYRIGRGGELLEATGAARLGRIQDRSQLSSADLTAGGAGRSIDARYSIWSMDVPKAGVVSLGPPGLGNERTSMYGIAAQPK